MMIFVNVILGLVVFLVSFYFGFRFLKNANCGTTVANITHNGIFPDARRYKIISGKISKKDLLERYCVAKGILGVSVYLNGTKSALLGFALVTLGFMSFVSFFVLGMIGYRVRKTYVYQGELLTSDYYLNIII